MDGAAATSPERNARRARGAGIGLRLPHLAEVAAGAAAVGWLEAHPENFVANPHARELLLEIARQHPLALHSVGISVGSATGLDRRHLARVRALAAELDPVLVSGHLAWSAHGAAYLNDLLPLPYTEESLRVVAAHVDEVQDTLGCRYLVENPASYLGFAGSTLDETTFLAELVARTGCGLLCDVSNAYLSAANLGFDAYAYIDAIPADAVCELHLGGFTRERDEATPGGDVLIDTHAAAIAEPVWDLYSHALRRFRSVPTLIEWDNDLPSFARLQGEAERAETIASAVLRRGPRRATAG
jgi:uncharacterized protein (UPF0276 family)